MATMNPFDLLGEDDGEDPAKLIEAAKKAAPKKETPAPKKETAAPGKPQPAAKLPAKPLPPAQAVRETKTESERRGGRGGERGYGDRGYGRGGGGYNRDQPKENSFSNRNQGGIEEGDGGKSFERRGGYNGPPRSSFRGGRRGEFGSGEVGNEERPRRPYERRSGTGRGNEVKREGAGRGNWGTATDEIAQETAEVVDEAEKNVDSEKPLGEEEATDVNKETPAKEPEEKEPVPEDKEMTLQEYEKVLEEKRKALQALKTTEGRKVDDKAFATMQALSNKKDNDEIFVKLGSDKRKEMAEKEEKAKKSPVSFGEFFKPAEGEKYYGGSGRRGARGGGRGPREGYGGGGRPSYHVEAPKIEDPGQFPTLGAK